MSRRRRLAGWACAGLFIASLLALSAGAASAFYAVYQVDLRSAQTPDGVVIFGASDDAILIPGAGGNPQQAPGVG